MVKYRYGIEYYRFQEGASRIWEGSATYRLAKSGEKNTNWKGGITPRSLDFTMCHRRYDYENNNGEAIKIA
jgi:hypothetical protein